MNKVKLCLLIIVILILGGCSIKSTNTDLSNDNIIIDKTNGNILDELEDKKTSSIENAHPIAVLDDGRKVFLQVNPEVDNSIFVTSSDSSIIFKINAGISKNIYDAKVMGNWIVYVESSNDMTKSDWALYAKNIDDNRRIEIDKGNVVNAKVKTPTLLGALIAASNDKIVWTAFEKDEKSVNAIVKLYDIENNTYKIIDRLNVEDGEFGQPGLDGDWLVYDIGKIDMKALARNGKLVLVNLKNNEKRILDEGLKVSGASIKFPYGVWNSGDSILKLYNIKTKEEKTIVNWGMTGVWNSSLNDKFISWNTNGDGLYIYSIEKGEILKLKDSGITSGGNISDNILWWYVKGEKCKSEWITLD
ncbi:MULTISPECIES: hypothetical protein [Thermoanaerobacterium]|uniref:Lipoprotein n=2 Tax=Thermoanaerobacterium TaxID=28895 RepID=W9E864_9THEO|nr:MULTISPECIES: hypothetical protein [Thermoanaerobacterium]AFK85818.1 hypothetical protein Tsac_0796 [Thermoanaerobacterium saccharolyticum JW/SL-YS485]ETO37973.1 hypothetical protein V518_1839 [Thermoanaerobacterium aotearoense SCUT27]